MQKTEKKVSRVLVIIIAIIVAIGGVIFIFRDQVSDMAFNVMLSFMSEPVEGSYKYKTKNINTDINGQSIYGIAYIPEKSEPMPLVIMANGLGTSHTIMVDYAESIASHGAAAYIFDFRGGSARSRSDGLTTEMSIMTQVADIEAIMAAAREWDFVDPDKIVLIGGSQGGYVSAVTAARHADEIAGLVLVCPAFVINDNIYDMFPSKDDITDEFNLMGWIDVGRNYAEDIWDYDIFSEIGGYTGRVLLVHGDQDDIVDLSYSERAVEAYENAELWVIQGAGHAITGDGFTEAMNHILAYLRELEICP